MQNKYKYQFTELAAKDLDEVLSYIANKLCNPKAASDLFSEVESKIDSICEFPFSYPDCTYYYVTDINIRHISINNYILVYKIEEDMITFLRFVYSKRKNIL